MTSLRVKNKKIGIVVSCGGHFTQARLLAPAYANYEHFYVLNDKVKLADSLSGKIYFVARFERDLKFFKNLYEAAMILRKEKPDLLLSTGSGIIIPFVLIAKLMGIKTIYIESVASVVRPTLTGRMMYYLTKHFYYQWPNLKKFFPKGECIGTLL